MAASDLAAIAAWYRGKVAPTFNVNFSGDYWRVPDIFRFQAEKL